jgi:hypothetical protein
MSRDFLGYGKHLPGQLLVEGSNDFHVLCSLFQKRKIPRNVFGIKEKGSYEELCDGLDVELDVEHVETVGIIVDTDESLENRWRDIRKLIVSLGYSEIPDEPQPEGCILPGRKRLGIWLMPDNQAKTGVLENFVAYLVSEPKTNPLWLQAKRTVAELPDDPQKFPKGRLAKAEMYTWLAWQKEPGIPMGRAIMERYLDPNSPLADPFINWIKRLFQLT